MYTQPQAQAASTSTERQQASTLFRCQPPAQIQTTGDAPLSLGAEATPTLSPFSLSVATSLPPLLPLGILQRQMVP